MNFNYKNKIITKLNKFLELSINLKFRMFRIAQLFNLTDDIKFYQMFQSMDPKEFEFFTDRKTYDSWVLNFQLLSSDGINQMKKYIDEKNDPLMSRRFDEMRLLFSPNYLKKVRGDIEKVYRAWFQKIENSNFHTLRYLALKYNLGDMIEKVFELQKDSPTLRSVDVDDIDQVMIVCGNPFFYFCKKFTDYQNFDTSSIKLLREYQLKSFLDTPIFGISYSTKFNPAYGNIMNCQYGYNLSGKQMIYVLLKVYNLEKLLDPPPQQPANKSTSNTDSESESEDDN
jgi:hypothetical protein